MARAIEDPGSLSTEDHVVLFNLYMAEFAKAMRSEQLEGYKIPRSTIARWIGLTANPYGYAWWKSQRRLLSTFVPQLHAALELELEQDGPKHANRNRESMMAIQQELLDLRGVE